jgi:hypothetical protein
MVRGILILTILIIHNGGRVLHQLDLLRQFNTREKIGFPYTTSVTLIASVCHNITFVKGKAVPVLN